MKAIETLYKKRRFRSRLEARYAVLLDALGVTWEYEKEGYELDGMLYLPDFWLPEQDCWLEIKGQEPTEEEQEKARRLSIYTGKDVCIRYGDISPESGKLHVFSPLEPIERDNNRYLGFLGSQRNWFRRWGACKKCKAVGVAFGHIYHRKLQRDECELVGYSEVQDHERIDAAFAAAIQARFEFGETPN